jgi:hypothetical protein
MGRNRAPEDVFATRHSKGRHVNKSRDDTLKAIEETQAALRDSIEAAKDLAEKSERLISQHRKEIESKDKA